MNTEKVIYSALAGFAAGLVLGLLFAPEKGSETRQMIARKGQDYSSSLKNKFTNARGKAEDALNQAKDEAKEMAGKGKNVAEQAKKEVKQTLKSNQSYQA